ncbi:hypothetical protein VNO78_31643 [Psophocarpus tetragonolobus]|uniref:Uncharacterized protein n=1 Tax=Psophocarpus tetragonolobus TaxID=3891 RepID=A0AAN9X9Q1_PSOTE
MQTKGLIHKKITQAKCWVSKIKLKFFSAAAAASAVGSRQPPQQTGNDAGYRSAKAVDTHLEPPQDGKAMPLRPVEVKKLGGNALDLLPTRLRGERAREAQKRGIVLLLHNSKPLAGEGFGEGGCGDFDGAKEDDGAAEESAKIALRGVSVLTLLKCEKSETCTCLVCGVSEGGCENEGEVTHLGRVSLCAK